MKLTPLILCLLCAGCSSRASAPNTRKPETPGTGTIAPDGPRNYEPGPWWQGDMRSLFVSAAQILVTHRESQPVGFLHYVRPSDRSKAQAIEVAQALQAQLQQEPSQFAALAVRSSDDRVSGVLGGVLGTFRPLNVMQPVADALGHIEIAKFRGSSSPRSAITSSSDWLRQRISRCPSRTS